MSSSASDPDAHGSRPFAEPEAELADRSQDRELLDKVLQETLALTNPDGPLSQRELDALAAVVRRHSSASISLEGIVELIETVLSNRLGSFSENERSLSVLARELAETMRDDAQTWERLEAFWARLSEAAQ